METVDQELRRRHDIIQELKINLQGAQGRMKRNADLKRKPFEFEENAWVWLKLQPYRQNFVEFRQSLKLSKRYFGPFQIKKKISSVAYRLALPEGSTIFPVFHISLLKPFVGDIEAVQVRELPPLAVDAHPIEVPARIRGYRIVTVKGQKLEQVLVEWMGRSAEERS